jgi:hypothetical protein
LNGKIEYNGILSKVNKYNQQEMAKSFAILLDELIK